MKVSCCL